MSNAKASDSAEATRTEALGKSDEELRKEAREVFQEIIEGKSTRPSGVGGKAISVRVTDTQEQLLKQCVEQSAYENITEYMKNVGLGWDRNGSIIARAGVAIRWLQNHTGKNIGKNEWEELRAMLNAVYEPTNEREPAEDSLEDLLALISRHLLAAKERTVTEELGMPSRHA